METKRLIEILKLVRNELIFDTTTFHELGICNVFSYLKQNNFVSFSEANYVIDYIYKNKPNNQNDYAEFMNNQYWCDKMYWWNRMYINPETRQIRIDYLAKLIDNVK